MPETFKDEFTIRSIWGERFLRRRSSRDFGFSPDGLFPLFSFPKNCLDRYRNDLSFLDPNRFRRAMEAQPGSFEVFLGLVVLLGHPMITTRICL
jgi:hypothetical protein